MRVRDPVPAIHQPATPQAPARAPGATAAMMLTMVTTMMMMRSSARTPHVELDLDGAVPLQVEPPVAYLGYRGCSCNGIDDCVLAHGAPAVLAAGRLGHHHHHRITGLIVAQNAIW